MSDLYKLEQYLQGKGASNAAQLLMQADNYIQMYNKMPEAFVLPKDHAVLKPVVEEFHDDLGGFVDFAKKVRDNLTSGAERGEVNAFFRLIQTRHVQQQRRERVAAAVDKAIEMYGDVEFSVRQLWIAKLEHRWATRRLAFMDAMRKGLGNKRLTSEQRAEAAAEFWSMLDQELANGEGIPKWK